MLGAIRERNTERPAEQEGEPRRFERLSNKKPWPLDQGFLYQCSACKTEKLLLHATTDQGDTAEAKKGS